LFGKQTERCAPEDYRNSSFQNIFVSETHFSSIGICLFVLQGHYDGDVCMIWGGAPFDV
jgi:hypothetical protein